MLLKSSAHLGDAEFTCLPLTTKMASVADISACDTVSILIWQKLPRDYTYFVGSSTMLLQ